MVWSILAQRLLIPQQNVQKRRKAMTTPWIIIGCLFVTGIGIRFTYKVMGLKPAEATAVYVLIALLVGVNTAPVREFITLLF